jgi:hypothetical protein
MGQALAQHGSVLTRSHPLHVPCRHPAPDNAAAFTMTFAHAHSSPLQHVLYASTGRPAAPSGTGCRSPRISSPPSPSAPPAASTARWPRSVTRSSCASRWPPPVNTTSVVQLGASNATVTGGPLAFTATVPVTTDGRPWRGFSDRIRVSALEGGVWHIGIRTTDGSGVMIDETGPAFGNVIMTTSNADPTLAAAGDTITVTFMTTEALLGLPVVEIEGRPAAVTTTGHLHYAASLTLTQAQLEAGSGDFMRFTITGTDVAGNEGDLVDTQVSSGDLLTALRSPTPLRWRRRAFR